MKRKGNLYQEIYNFQNIVSAYNEVCKNTKNKRKVAKFKEYKCIYISRIHNILKLKLYKPNPYNVFTIYEPKELLPCLLDVNVASRKGLGTSAGIRLSTKFHRICKTKYQKYYILKCDISKFFASIDHDILKKKVERRIKDKDSLNIIFDIIDSYSPGLGIGSMTNQVLAIFYLNDLDHFIKETLKIKYFLRYQDDFLLFHHSKKYLEYCFEQIKNFLKKEKLTLNKKSRIYSSNDNFLFLRYKL